MAGTDRRRSVALAGGPAVVLVRPQLGQNIGMVARAMLNCGLTDLRLVCPRDGWPSAEAQAAASGADRVLEAARLFDDTAAAVADLQRVYATSARGRGMVQRVVTPRRAAEEMRGAILAGQRVGLLFGPERSGLTNDDVALADSVLQVPLNPAFASLNLAQAVLIAGYEWYHLTGEPMPERIDAGCAPLAAKSELIGFLERLEAELDATGFLYPPEKRPNMVRNLRSLFQRIGLTSPEVKTLHGIVSALRGRKRRGDKPDGGAAEGGEGRAGVD